MAVAQETIGEGHARRGRGVLDALCTPPAVAAMLGLTPPVIYGAIRRGGEGLTCIRTPGGQIRVRRRDVLAYCHRAGHPVPYELLPPGLEIVLIHPDALFGRRAKTVLEGRYRVEWHRDVVDGLLAVSALDPPLVVVSCEVGDEVLRRLGAAVAEGTKRGYAALVVLDRTPRIPPWRGESFASHLSLDEDGNRALARLAICANLLLGTP